MNNNYLKKIIESFYKEIDNNYLTNSEYRNIKQKYKKYYKEIKRRKIDHKFIKKYKNLKNHNKNYIKNELKNNKEYFDTINGYGLDRQQRIVVVSDEDNLLVAAGAGSGKTTTISAKIKYLVEKKQINPRDILCISFTKDATENLKNKNKEYDIDAYTFHSLGYNIIKKNLNQLPVLCDDDDLKTIIDNYFNKFREYDLIIDYMNKYLSLEETKDENKQNLNNILHKNITNKEKYELLLKYHYLDNLKQTLENFICLFKSNNYKIEIYYKLYRKNKKVKNKIKRKKEYIFLKLSKDIFYDYENYLEKNNKIDFNDMINKATDLVKNNSIHKYKYIIVDEYQDTSKTRYDLLYEIKKKTDAKLIVVGDDFQSIFRFTGCNLDIFLNFRKYFKDSKILKLENTYRNSQELINVSGRFIMKNKKQIKKKLKSNKRIKKPIKIYLYDNLKEELVNILDKLDGEIYILGRNNQDINQIVDNNLFKLNKNNIIYKNKKIKYLTVHKSKGLEADNVILLNLNDKKNGFPNKMIDDDNLKYVLNFKENIPYEEERRLFYVALTRTKNNCYILSDKKNISIFVKEIMNDKNVEVMKI